MTSRKSGSEEFTVDFPDDCMLLFIQGAPQHIGATWRQAGYAGNKKAPQKEALTHALTRPSLGQNMNRDNAFDARLPAAQHLASNIMDLDALIAALSQNHLLKTSAPEYAVGFVRAATSVFSVAEIEAMLRN